MCFQASSTHNVKQCKSSIKVFLDPKVNDFWQTSPFSPPHVKLTRCDGGTQASRLMWNLPSCLTSPRCPGRSQRCLLQLLRESSLFDDEGWIKTQRRQERIVKQPNKSLLEKWPTGLDQVRESQHRKTWNIRRLNNESWSENENHCRLAWLTEQKHEYGSICAYVFTPERMC